jgi:hypothetical protein
VIELFSALLFLKIKKVHDGKCLKRLVNQAKESMKVKMEILCPCLSGAMSRVQMLREIGLFPKEYVHYYDCPEWRFMSLSNTG